MAFSAAKSSFWASMGAQAAPRFSAKPAVLATSPVATSGGSCYDFSIYTSKYFLTGALAGGVCCSITHGAACPIDVVKTRIQLDPVTYNQGLIGGFRQVIAAEGAGALATGLVPTAGGYFVQGWFKFGGFEFFKVSLAKSYGDQGAWDNRFMLNSMAAAGAEFIADIFLCPFEATRIKQVSDAEMASLSMPAAAAAMAAKDGVVNAFYSGFIPILCKQVPYTIAKFVVQDSAQEQIYNMVCPDRKQASGTTKTCISLTSGVIAGVVAAIISHPADTLLSKINKAGAGGEGGMFTRLGRIAVELGPVNLCLVGLPARCVMIGGITAGQFGIFDAMLPIAGIEKFHYHNPASH